jgi:hypothetical protein
MNPNRKAFYPDVIIFAVCWSVACFVAGLWMGEERATQAPKVCAKVLGMTPVSSTADTCTYIMGTQGRAYWKYLAVKESKK